VEQALKPVAAPGRVHFDHAIGRTLTQLGRLLRVSEYGWVFAKTEALFAMRHYIGRPKALGHLIDALFGSKVALKAILEGRAKLRFRKTPTAAEL